MATDTSSRMEARSGSSASTGTTAGPSGSTARGLSNALVDVLSRMNFALAILIAMVSISLWQNHRLASLMPPPLHVHDDHRASYNHQHRPSDATSCTDTVRAIEQLEAEVGDLRYEVTRLRAALKDGDGVMAGSSRAHGVDTNNNVDGSRGVPLDQSHRDSTAIDNKLGTRTIHFMYGLWDDKPMPPEFESNLAVWRRLNPAWQVKVWSNKEVKDFWKDEFPEYRKLWRKARPIQRADFARYLIVYKYGGLYADLDCTPTKPIDEIFHLGGLRFVAHDTLLCIEDEKTEAEMARSALWPIRGGVPELKTRIANYVFWAKPRSETFKRAIALAASRLESVPDAMYHVSPTQTHLQNPYAIIYTTGPDVLTEATFRHGVDPGVLILPADKCHMNNLATGTWIGDSNAATVQGPP
eukprot:m.188735 g.188735  ORF g.188735 m.188735 type:complete len:412 (+) comp17528_c0_seq1:286-1521(+)